jgi:hypothetical protein
MPTTRQQSVMAYLTGAGVAGTLLIGPFVGRPFVVQAFPKFRDLAYTFPFFLLPVAWGLWNWLYVRRQPRVAIGTWGALLGGLLVLAANVLFLAQGQWIPVLLLAFLTVPAGYYLLWSFVVGTVNEMVGL